MRYTRCSGGLICATNLCEHFGLSMEGFLADSFSPQSIDRISIARRDVQSYSCAAALLELIMLKRGVLYTPLDIFCSSDCEIDIAVSSLCNAWCSFF